MGHAGRDLGVYAPALSQYPSTTQAIGTPSVRTGLVSDVYLTLVSPPDDHDTVVIGVRINPMVLWLWVGGAVMAAGTVLAAWPSQRRRRRTVGGRPEDEATVNTEGEARSPAAVASS